MARAVSKTKTIIHQDRVLLRAIYYHQNLPQELIVGNTPILAKRLTILEMGGLIRRKEGKFELTDEGILTMKRMYGGKRPPLIDFKYDAMLEGKKRKREFIVGSSLASELARRVSFGE